MLIDRQAQNIVTVFGVETLAGCKWNNNKKAQKLVKTEQHSILIVSEFLCGLTCRQVEDDADWGRVVDDVRPLVQVVHIVAAVIATVTEHQLQNQVLWESQETAAWELERLSPWQQRRPESLFSYSIVAAPRKLVWVFSERDESCSAVVNCVLRKSYLNRSLLLADIVGLQLFWLWQCSADRRPETDSWDERAAANNADHDDHYTVCPDNKMLIKNYKRCS